MLKMTNNREYRVIVVENGDYLFFFESGNGQDIKAKYEARYPEAEVEVTSVVNEADLASMISEVAGAY